MSVVLQQAFTLFLKKTCMRVISQRLELLLFFFTVYLLKLNFK